MKNAKGGRGDGWCAGKKNWSDHSINSLKRYSSYIGESTAEAKTLDVNTQNIMQGYVGLNVWFPEAH